MICLNVYLIQKGQFQISPTLIDSLEQYLAINDIEISKISPTIVDNLGQLLTI